MRGPQWRYVAQNGRIRTRGSAGNCRRPLESALDRFCDRTMRYRNQRTTGCEIGTCVPTTPPGLSPIRRIGTRIQAASSHGMPVVGLRGARDSEGCQVCTISCIGVHTEPDVALPRPFVHGLACLPSRLFAYGSYLQKKPLRGDRLKAGTRSKRCRGQRRNRPSVLDRWPVDQVSRMQFSLPCSFSS